MFANLEEQTLKDNTFEKIIKFGITPWFVIRGTIDIQGKMSGTLVAEKNTMCDLTRLEWTTAR